MWLAAPARAAGARPLGYANVHLTAGWRFTLRLQVRWQMRGQLNRDVGGVLVRLWQSMVLASLPVGARSGRRLSSRHALLWETLAHGVDDLAERMVSRK